jgi:hypothetical protein
MKTKLKLPETQIAKFVPISDIIPKDWHGWFYDVISQDAPFSWGDNNRTLIDAISFGHHAEDVLDIEESFGNNIEEDGSIKGREEFFDILNALAKKNIYVDLEN